MSPRELPERPDLEQLKRQAKDLLQAARNRDAAALARFRILPAFARIPDADLARAPLALHDAQSVVAREHGLDSWNALRERVEERTLAFGAAVEQFVEAATGGRRDRAERLLALHPGIARATFHTALLLGDAGQVERRVAAEPALATAAGGPRGWEPLHYVCHSALGGSAPREAGLAAVAALLIGRGADPNLRFPWLHHGVRRPVLWGAVCEVRSLALAEALLDAGADPSDGVTLPLAAAAAISPRSICCSRAAPTSTIRGRPMAARRSTRSSTGPARPTGVYWLLEHGADPDPVFDANGETPLHVVAADWNVDLAESGWSAGAPTSRGRAPTAVRRMPSPCCTTIAPSPTGWPRTAGRANLSDVDRLVAACSRGDRAAALAMLARHPELAPRSAPSTMPRSIARRNATMPRRSRRCSPAGSIPNRPDESIGKTALHVAAMEGWPGAARVLLDHGASVDIRDREFHGQPLIWAAEGSRGAREGRDHAAVGRMLLEAGSPVAWASGAEPSEGIIDIVNAWRGIRAGLIGSGGNA